jgi:dihydroxyacetone kinase-like predicted kinase
MAARQVEELCDKTVRILPTKSVMQAITALIAYNADGELEEVLGNMENEMQKVAYAEITRAVKDSPLNGLDIKEGDIIGLINGKISSKGAAAEEVLLQLLEDMVNEDVALLTVLYGDEIDEARALKLKEQLAEEYPECEVEMHYGGQPHYSYLLSVE